ncbi:MAG: transposase, partial [Myxococcales bacterium]|nr:transposase [Myxococcales bacterium]
MTRCCADYELLRFGTTRTQMNFGASMAHRFESHVAVRVGGKGADPDEAADHALGRSRGGFGTRIHLLCDADGNPLHFHLSPGQAHDSTMLDTVLEGADVELHDEDGVAHAGPLKLAGDKGYRACERPAAQEPPAPFRDIWTYESLARSLEEQTGYRLSVSEVGRILRFEKIRPHRIRQWLKRSDPNFLPKAKRVCNLYIRPPKNAVVVCV